MAKELPEYEYIRRVDAVFALTNSEAQAALKGMSGADAYNTVLQKLNSIPAADAVPVRHGFWIDTGFVNSTGKIFLCSECNHNHNPNKKDVAAGRVEERPKHCPGCGARMDLEG